MTTPAPETIEAYHKTWMRPSSKSVLILPDIERPQQVRVFANLHFLQIGGQQGGGNARASWIVSAITTAKAANSRALVSFISLFLLRDKHLLHYEYTKILY